MTILFRTLRLLESRIKNEFWQTENTIEDGVYFATHFIRESSCVLTSTHYTLHLIESDDCRLTAYFLHSVAMKHRLKDLSYENQDHAWHISEMPDTEAPELLSFTRTMQSDYWPMQVEWMQNSVQDDIECLETLVQTSVHISSYEDCDYAFPQSLYAITQETVYVFDEDEEYFYKLPQYTEHKFKNITINDNVGIFVINSSSLPRHR